MKSINNSNDFSKRTSNQINKILRQNNIVDKCENQGDGRLFCILNSLSNAVNLKNSGFLVQRGNQSDKYIYFKAF